MAQYHISQHKYVCVEEEDSCSSEYETDSEEECERLAQHQSSSRTLSGAGHGSKVLGAGSAAFDKSVSVAKVSGAGSSASGSSVSVATGTGEKQQKHSQGCSNGKDCGCGCGGVKRGGGTSGYSYQQQQEYTSDGRTYSKQQQQNSYRPNGNQCFEEQYNSYNQSPVTVPTKYNYQQQQEYNGNAGAYSTNQQRNSSKSNSNQRLQQQHDYELQQYSTYGPSTYQDFEGLSLIEEPAQAGSGGVDSKKQQYYSSKANGNQGWQQQQYTNGNQGWQQQYTNELQDYSTYGPSTYQDFEDLSFQGAAQHYNGSHMANVAQGRGQSNSKYYKNNDQQSYVTDTMATQAFARDHYNVSQKANVNYSQKPSLECSSSSSYVPYNNYYESNSQRFDESDYMKTPSFPLNVHNPVHNPRMATITKVSYSQRTKTFGHCK